MINTTMSPIMPLVIVVANVAAFNDIVKSAEAITKIIKKNSFIAIPDIVAKSSFT